MVGYTLARYHWQGIASAPKLLDVIQHHLAVSYGCRIRESGEHDLCLSGIRARAPACCPHYLP
jgi:hypothetical protein